MIIENFLQRINYTDAIKNDYWTLRKLQEKFLLNVPFENLSMYYNKKRLTVNPEAAYEKIVELRRGGLCYECNGLFYSMLLQLGFDVQMLSARITPAGSLPRPEFSHMCLRVNIGENKYIVDVGNGQSFRSPLLENGNNEAIIPEGFSFRFGPHIEGNTLYYKNITGAWATKFHLSVVAYDFLHYEEMCIFHQESLESTFTQGPIVTLALPNGRIFATKEKFVENINGRITEDSLNAEEEFQYYLKERFNITI